MGRFYSVSFGNVAVSAVVDLFELNAPSDAIVVVHSITLGQSSDAGDAAAELLQLELTRSTGASGSGGLSLTPRPHNGGDAAFGGTVERLNTTQATTRTIMQHETWNIMVGWFYRPTPEERIVISPSGRLCLKQATAPLDPITMSATMIIEEIGG